jgi:hypothetical protein
MKIERRKKIDTDKHAVKTFYRVLVPMNSAPKTEKKP